MQKLFFKSLYLTVTLANTLYSLHILIGAESLLSRDSFRWIDEEVKLIGLSRKYIDVEDERLNKLENYQEELTEHAKLYKNEDDLAFNPLAIYKAIKHLTVDLDDAIMKMKNNKYDDSMTQLREKTISLPAEDHIHDAVRHLFHLQQVYDLKVANLIEGRLSSNITIAPALTPNDCHYISVLSSETNDHETVVKWLRECRAGLSNTTVATAAARLLLRSSLIVGNFSLAREMSNYCLSKDRNDRIMADLSINVSLRLGNWLDVRQYLVWEHFNVCAGDYEYKWPYRRLTCRYNHRKSPFLIIAPLKEELISLVPSISIFREALYDSEIEQLKEEIYPRLKPGAFIDRSGTGRSEPRYFPSYRNSLKGIEVNYTNLYNRFADMSGLMYHPLAGLQIVYYVPGGFIRVHSDYMSSKGIFIEELYLDRARKTKFFSLIKSVSTFVKDPYVQQHGHRIAQAVLYLSDVILGGETVFPFLKLKIPPVKGSIAMWSNMRSDGAEDVFSAHAGCPVVMGLKILGTQWYRMKLQDRWITKPEDKVTPKMIQRRSNFDLNIKRRE